MVKIIFVWFMALANILLFFFLYFFSLSFGERILKEKIVCNIWNLSERYICQRDGIWDLRLIDIIIYDLPILIILCSITAYFMLKIIRHLYKKIEK